MSVDVIRSDIRAMTAYQVPVLDDNFIKLDAMEVPYLLPENLRQELAGLLANALINRYPNPAASGMQEALRQAFAIPEQAHIALGNGSDELIQLITQLVAKPDAKVLALDPSFVMYRHNAVLYGMTFVGVPLNADFSLNMEAVKAAIVEHQPVLIYLAYPNNPTGVPFKREDIQNIIDMAPGLVVVDEAYSAFADDSFLPQAGQPEHLLVLRTLSKMGFAGLRLGYVVGSPAVIGELAKIVPPYNMNQLSLTAAKFALQHINVINENIAILKTERERVRQALATLPDIEVFESQANFLTIRLPDAERAFELLKQNKILVKKLSGSHVLLANCLRLTIGKPEENDAVLQVLRDYMAQVQQAKKSLGSSTGSGSKTSIIWMILVVAIIAAIVLFFVFGQQAA